MNKIYPKAFFFFAFLLSAAQLFSQTLSDGPIQLQVKLRDMQYNIGTLSDFTLSIGSFNLPGSLSSDEPVLRVWARDKADVDGYGWGPLGGHAHFMNFGAPGIGPDFNELIYDQTFAGTTVPRYFDVRIYAFEDDVPNDFSPLGCITPCACTGTDTTYETGVCCLNLFGCLFSEGDDNLCDAQPYVQNLDYRLGYPCEWYNHGYINNPSACTGANYYHPRIESFWRYIDGASCASAIDLGTITSGTTRTHVNSTECYSNSHAASPGNDVWYKFTINGPIGITASLCDPITNFDTYLYLYNSCGAVVADTSDDNGCGLGGVSSSFAISLCQAGTYYLVVDGADNIPGVFKLTVQDNPNFVFSATPVVTDVSCFNGSDGQIVINVTGGAPPYTYAWSTPQGNGNTATGLTGGTYSYSVTDTKGCQITGDTTVNVPTQLTATAVGTPVTCGGACDGSATVTPAGGTSPYTYGWNSIPPQQLSTATFLCAGNYTVTVIDNKGCTAVASATVANTTTVVITLDSLKNVQCFGANNGGIFISTAGGQTPYTYAWSNNVTTEDNPNLGPNTYTLVVTDNIGCTVGDSYTVTEPPLLTSSVAFTYNPRCNGGMDGIVDITVGGGVQPYTYQWSAPSNATTQNLNNVGAATHTVTVTDANGCTVTSDTTLTEPTAYTVTVTPGNVKCFGDTNGTASVNVGGATPPYTIVWSNQDQGTSTSGLSPGPFSVVITDANGCNSLQYGTIGSPQPLTVTAAPVEPLCASQGSGSVNTTVNGGTQTYSYNWTGTGGFTSTSANPQVPSGTYQVTVTDVNLCTASAAATVNSPVELVVKMFPRNPVCIDDSTGGVVVAPEGGTSPYTFAWSNSSTAQELTGLAGPSSYSVTVTDVNGCTATGSSQIKNPDVNPESCQADKFVVLVPTAFSPNGDNINDKLVAIMRNVQKLEFKVYNRWGELVYENMNMLPGDGWDGIFRNREQPMGTYVWVYNADFINGERSIKNGSTTLVR